MTTSTGLFRRLVLNALALGGGSKRAFLSLFLLGLGMLGAQIAGGADKFLLLNYSPNGFATYHSSAAIMNYVAQTFGTTNQASSLKVGVACLYYPGLNGSSSELALLTNDLARAQSLGIPILVQVDTENWLPTSLLNWYDSGLPGYDSAKKADVEWYGWDQTNAVKLSWRNWGFPFRIGPAPNLLSTNVQAYEKGIYDLFLPAVLQWYTNLPANKKWLFVGWKCGWESTINDNYRFFTNGNSYYGTTNDPPWSDNYQPLGYNAAKTAGVRTNGAFTTDDKAKIVGRHLSYLAKMASDAGIPRGKISVHGTSYGTYEQDVDALVNPYGNPGVSYYGSSGSPLKYNAALMQAVQTAKTSYGATGYVYGEFNLFTTNYSTWYGWFQNALQDDPDCIYQTLYNYDSMYGLPSVEKALLDAMALYPATYPLPPVIAGLSPNTGRTNGGTRVTLTGSNFLAGVTVQFGGNPAVAAMLIASNTVTISTPANTAGVVNVIVLNTNGLSATNQFTYVPPPPPATLSRLAISDSNLNLVWLGGTNASCTLLTATNVTDARVTWTPVATNVVGDNGLSTNHIPVNVSELQRFYLLAIPCH